MPVLFAGTTAFVSPRLRTPYGEQRTAESGPRRADQAIGDAMRRADAQMAAGRPAEAVATLRKVTATAPALPRAWYALGQAYNAIKQDALATFDARADEEAWRKLVRADALLAKSQFTDAFVFYRSALEELPAMVSIHDSIARIYERTGHAAWAARERAIGALSTAECAGRAALCAFRAGQFRSALTATLDRDDGPSRYWRSRAAAELALAAFRQLDRLADSPERRVVRATVARAEERYTDAITELKAATTLAPGNQALIFELASAYYASRDYDRALATVSPLLDANREDPRLLKLAGYSLLQSRRADEALPLLKHAVERDRSDPGTQIALGKAYFLTGDFKSAIPLIEPQLATDEDGSLHVQLARAYSGVGESEKAAALLARSQEIQRASEERNAAMARRAISAPK